MDKGDIVTLLNGPHEATGLTSEKLAIGAVLLALFALAVCVDIARRR